MSDETTATQDPALAWYRAECLATNADHACGILWGFEAGGVEVIDETTFMEDADWAPVPDGKTRLVAYFETATPEQLYRDLGAALAAGHVQLISLAEYTDTSWQLKWRDYFKPRALSARFTVGPPWEPPVAPEGGDTVIIDPGMAFGTGTHETTQLCAAVLDDQLSAHVPASLLDVGCGSAILSILSAKLGVKAVIGVDVEEEAIESARLNLPLNGLTDEDVALSTTPLAEVPGTFEVVVANILLHILIALREDLRAHVAPGGTLLLSGIGTHQHEQAREAFDAEGWTLLEERTDGEWMAFRYLREEG